MSKVVEISQARFNALCFSREPLALLMFQERGWYADSDEKVLGVLLYDNSDSDYGYVVLGRDEVGIFRNIDCNHSFEIAEHAIVDMSEKMRQWAKEAEGVYPQGDVRRKKNEIFVHVVPRERLHPSFIKLSMLTGFSPAKEIIKEAVYAYIDVDGNYIEQFQTTGFDSRMWELYLFVTFYQMGYKILRDYDAPDYVLQYGAESFICVEAVTVNPTQNSSEPVPPPPKSAEDLISLTRGYFPIKYGSALYSKLNKEYWKKPHIMGKPLVFAIADFHQTRSMLWSRTALMEYLYGIHTEGHRDSDGKLHITNVKIDFHEYLSKKIPSGFFNLPRAENVSGIMFSNQGTISKFNRMGKIAGFGDKKVKLIVEGFFHDHNPDAAEPIPFKADVGDPRYDELWVDGLTFYHNPNALHPLPRDAFPEEVGQYFLVDGVIEAKLPEFYPYGSTTTILVEDETQTGRHHTKKKKTKKRK